MLARPHQQPPAAVKFHNLASWRKKFQKNPSSSMLSQILCPGRTCPSGTHSDRSNGPEIENLLWKAHTLSIFCLMKKMLGLVILWTLLYEICLFFSNFSQIWFLAKPLQCFDKNCSKINFIWYYRPILYLCQKDATKNQFWSKLLKMGNFHKANSIKWLSPNFFS